MPLAHGFLSEMLTPFGWAAFAIGKWHLTPVEDMSLAANRKWWPLGRGFDRYYGFLGGDTDQWYPWLTYDNHFVKPPKTPEEGYHNVPDLADKAKEFIADLKQVAPDRPFFMYFCPGACHAPHHAPKEWIAKYKGAFDAGWDDYREKALANQIKMGICPAGTKLSPRDPYVPEWTKLTKPREGTVHPRDGGLRGVPFLRRSTTSASWSTFLKEIGQLDNTLIITVSDNGASPEGGPNGSLQRNAVHEQRAGNGRFEPRSTSRNGVGRDLSSLLVGLGLGDQHAVPQVERNRGPGRHLRPVHRPLAQGHQVQGGHSPSVRACDRPGADHPGGGQAEDAVVHQRRRPGAH